MLIFIRIYNSKQMEIVQKLVQIKAICILLQYATIDDGGKARP